MIALLLVNGEIPMGSPPTGATNAVGMGKNWPLSTESAITRKRYKIDA